MEIDTQESLKGQHLTVLPFETYPAMDIKRNESGHIVEMTGFTVEVFNYVVRSMDLTYTLIQDEALNYEDDEINGTRRMGTLSFCIEKKTDVVVGGMVMSADVCKIVDVARLESSILACMIPAPQSTTYLGATWLPFSHLVWIVLFLFVTFFVGLLYGFSRLEGNHMNPETTRTNKISDLYNAMDYSFRTLISQGTSLGSKMIGFRVLIGTWALGSFLLVNYYNSILTSFFTAQIINH